MTHTVTVKNHEKWILEFSLTEHGLFSFKIKDVFGMVYGPIHKIAFLDIDPAVIHMLSQTSDEDEKNLSLGNYIAQLLQSMLQHNNPHGFSVVRTPNDINIFFGSSGLKGGGLIGKFIADVMSGKHFKKIAAATSLAQTGVGLLLVAGSGGALLPIAGATLLGSGMSGTFYAIGTSNADLDVKEYAKKSVSGAIQGLATSGLGAALTPAWIAQGGKDLLSLKGLVTKGVINSTTGVGGYVANNVTTGLFEEDHQSLKKLATVKGIKEASVAGASSLISGSVGDVLPHVGKRIPGADLAEGIMKRLPGRQVVTKLVDAVDDDVVDIISATTVGGVLGSASSAAGTAVTNLCSGKPMGEGMKEAVMVGGINGAIIGGVRKSAEIRTQKRKLKERTTNDLDLAEQDLDDLDRAGVKRGKSEITDMPEHSECSQEQSATSSNEKSKSTIYYFSEPLDNKILKKLAHIDSRARHTGIIIDDPIQGLVKVEIDADKSRVMQLNTTELAEYHRQTNSVKGRWSLKVGETSMSLDSLVSRGAGWVKDYPTYNPVGDNCRAFTDFMLKDVVNDSKFISAFSGTENFSKGSPCELIESHIQDQGFNTETHIKSNHQSSSVTDNQSTLFHSRRMSRCLDRAQENAMRRSTTLGAK